MKLYDFPPSHNCYKVRLLLAILGLNYQKQNVDLMARENRTPDFLRINPRGQVPVLEDDGAPMWDSTAILVYLARRYGRTQWLPSDAMELARISQWMAVAQNELLYGLGRAHWLRRGGSGNLKEAMNRGQRGLRVLDMQLGATRWLAVDRPTIADVACYPHASLAPEAGISLNEYAHVRRWCRSVESIPGYVDIWGGAPAPS